MKKTIFLIMAAAVLLSGCTNKKVSECNEVVEHLDEMNETLKNEVASLRKQIMGLKQDTVYFREVIKACGMLKRSADYDVSNSNKNINLEILSCAGDRSFQTVTIEFMISHQLAHQIFAVHTGGSGKPTAYDNIGNTFECKSVNFQSKRDDYIISLSTVDAVVPTDVRIKGSISFRNVLPSTEQFSFARFNYYCYNQDGGYGRTAYKVEMRNIPIIW